METEPLLPSRSRSPSSPSLGLSTWIQTAFNATNILVGVGLLSLPLGIKHAGWLLGILLLLFFATTTAFTARLLGKCLQSDQKLMSYSDLAFASYGSRFRIFTNMVFSFQLLAACVGLTILFGDSMADFAPRLSSLEWKLVAGLIVLPLFFVPYSVLSYTSLVGVCACVVVVMITLVSGLTKEHAPGCLMEPEPTHLIPQNWAALPLSFGLLMAPWGGHASFPNLYRDLRRPVDFDRSMLFTFSIALLLDLTMAVCGYLMYGEGTVAELSSNLLRTPGYPRGLAIGLILVIVIIPVVQIPLISRTLTMTIEFATSVHPTVLPPNTRFKTPSGSWTASYHILLTMIRVCLVAAIVGIAIVFPHFDGVMALMGSALCFTICIILPLLFYLRLYREQLGLWEGRLLWAIVCVASVMAVVGTVWALLPKQLILDA